MVVANMTTSFTSPVNMSKHASMHSSDGRETKKYLLLRDTVAKSKPSHSGGSRSRLLSKRSEQRVLKGSLWQEIRGARSQPILPPSTAKSLNRSASSPAPHNGDASSFKLLVESIEIEDLTLTCASAFLAEISAESCCLLLAIPTSEERFYVYADADRIYHSKFINVGSDVIVSKRKVPPCRATVKWKGRLAGKQGVWFGVEIMDEQSRGSGDSDGTVNNIKLFTCEKNSGMIVNIGQITLVPPKRPNRRPKKRAPSTPSLSSDNNYLTNGSDLRSRTESELSFRDDINSAETAPLVCLQVGDRVVWPSDHGDEEAYVRWIGTLPDDESAEGEILVGVEFDNPIGKGTGRYKNHQLFDSKRGHASLVPLDGLVKISSLSPSLRNPSDTSSQQSLSHTMHGFDSPSANQASAADVLQSLAIDESMSEPESSDYNNNSGHGSRDDKHDVQLEFIPSSSPQRLADLPDIDDSPERSGDHLSPPGTSQPLVNGSINMSTSSSDNLTPADNDMVDTYSRVPVSVTADTNHSSLPAASQANNSQVVDNNGWNDSIDSSSEHLAAFKPPVKPVSKGKLTTYHISKAYAHKSSLYSGRPSLSSRNKGRTKNGLVKMHSVGVRDVHDIADDLSLNSSDDSLSESPSRQLRNDVSPTNQPVEPAAGEPQHKPYLLVRMSNSPPNHVMQHAVHADVLPPLSQTAADDHSTTDAAVLSPLTERTSPVSISSFDNQTDPPSMINSVITVVPAPLADCQSSECDSETLHAVPYAPPEFAGDTAAIDIVYTGLWKGISGSFNTDSNFIDALLYLLSVSTDMLCVHDMASSYPNIKRLLLESITQPLRSGELVDVGVLNSWKGELDEITTGQMLSTANTREIHKFLTLLLQHIICIPPLYELNNRQSGYAMNLVACKDARVGFPTVQKLLEKTCIQHKIKLDKVPNFLILILTRSSTLEMIFPNLHIDLTDVLEYAKRICHMCGEQAVFECPECYEHESAELSAAAFCEPCSQTIHKHSKRVNHMPVQLKTESEVGHDDGSILILKGVLEMREGHYTSLSEPSGSATSANTEWLHFDSKAHLKESTSEGHRCYIPEVSAVAAVANWLSMDAYEQVAKDISSIPADIRRLLEDCCLCVYSKS